MRDKQYRDRYVEAHTRRFLALQIRKFRGGMSQAEFAGHLGKKQTAISRLEDAGYTGWSIRTILEIARKLNVAAIVRFVDFTTFLRFTRDQSESATSPAPYDEATVARDAELMARQDEGNTYPEATYPLVPYVNIAMMTAPSDVLPLSVMARGAYRSAVDTANWLDQTSTFLTGGGRPVQEALWVRSRNRSVDELTNENSTLMREDGVPADTANKVGNELGKHPLINQRPLAPGGLAQMMPVSSEQAMTSFA